MGNTKTSKGGASALSAGDQPAAADESNPGAGADASASASAGAAGAASSSNGEKEGVRAGSATKSTRFSPSSKSSIKSSLTAGSDGSSTSTRTSTRTSTGTSTGGTGSGSGSANNGSPPLPTGWVAKFDPVTKKTFYIETATGARQWERPDGGGSSDAGFKSVSAAAAAGSVNSREKEARTSGDKIERSKLSGGSRIRDKDEPVVRKAITSSLSSKGINSGASKSGGGVHGSSGAFRMNGDKKGSVGVKSKAHPSKTRGDEDAGEAAGAAGDE